MNRALPTSVAVVDVGVVETDRDVDSFCNE